MHYLFQSKLIRIKPFEGCLSNYTDAKDHHWSQPLVTIPKQDPPLPFFICNTESHSEVYVS